MPANHGLRANNDQVVLPSRPKARERDPESSVEWRWLRPGAFLGIHCELLSQRKLQDCLFLATPEESGHAAKERDQKNEQRVHWAKILREIPQQNESESRN